MQLQLKARLNLHSPPPSSHLIRTTMGRDVMCVTRTAQVRDVPSPDPGLTPHLLMLDTAAGLAKIAAPTPNGVAMPSGVAIRRATIVKIVMTVAMTVVTIDVAAMIVGTTVTRDAAMTTVVTTTDNGAARGSSPRKVAPLTGGGNGTSVRAAGLK